VENSKNASNDLTQQAPSRVVSLSKLVRPIRDVRRVVAQLLPAGHPTLSTVAAQMRISPRTLQRRLADNKLTHSQLVVQTRLTKACQLLAHRDVQIGDIAQKTGFASASSFSRAFHTWTGTSPRAFRNSLIGNVPDESGLPVSEVGE
jgi:AraC-like DNA-binding protein